MITLSSSIAGNKLTSPIPSTLPGYLTNSTLSKLTCITFYHNDSLEWCTDPSCRCGMPSITLFFYFPRISVAILLIYVFPSSSSSV